MRIHTTPKRQVPLSLQFVCIIVTCNLLLMGAFPEVEDGTQDSKHVTQREDLRSPLRVLNQTLTNGLQCRRILSAHTQEYVTCCGAPRSRSVKCLPSFIIAGVQKAGTTALSAMLCTHPNISFSKKKEVHFFDSLKRYNLGISEYLHNFHEWDTSGKGGSLPVYGESTPYYLASRDACRRISETIPDVKLVVLLREPVSRAYSEYQMKKRRVAAQSGFIELAVANSRILSHCLDHYRRQWTAITTCLPSTITSHSHYQKLITSLKTKARRPHRQHDSRKVQQEYSPQHENRNENENEIENSDVNVTDCTSYVSSRRSSGRQKLVTKSEKIEHGFITKKAKKSISIPELTLSNNLCEYGQSCLLTDGLISRNFSNYQHQLNENMGPLQHKMNYSLQNDSKNEEKAAAMLWVKQLLGKYERLAPLDEAFGKELKVWEECAGDLVGAGMTLESLDSAVEKCLVKKKGIQVGISSQYFYRSLYAVQLHNCFKYIPRERVFVVSAQSLQNHQEHTVDAILRFIGLPHNPKKTNIQNSELQGGGHVEDTIDGHYKGSINRELEGGAAALYHHQSTHPSHSQYSKQQSYLITAAVNTYFPSFGTSTGWLLNSEYDDLPKDLMADLVRFFRPYNSLLSGLLGDDSLEREWTNSGVDARTAEHSTSITVQ